LENTKKPVIHTDEKNKTKKYRITQSDIILQYFKDRPSQFFHYNNIRDWIKDETEKQSFKESKGHEKIMRTLAKNGKIIKISPGYFKYEKPKLK